jgi:hypothetical protein
MANMKSVNDLCKEHELTPEDLAARSGLDVERVMAIVMGRWTPTPNERVRVAGVFNLDKEQIAWGHKTPIQHIYGHGPA